jgi:hypothetical protein
MCLPSHAPDDDTYSKLPSSKNPCSIHSTKKLRCNALSCSALLCSALQAMGGRLSAAHSFQSLQSQLAGALLGMSCVCLRVFECKNAPFNPDKLWTGLDFVRQERHAGPGQDSERSVSFLPQCYTYVRRARGNTRSRLSRRRAWRCVRKRFIPSVIYIYSTYIRGSSD